MKLANNEEGKTCIMITLKVKKQTNKQTNKQTGPYSLFGKYSFGKTTGGIKLTPPAFLGLNKMILVKSITGALHGLPKLVYGYLADFNYFLL